MEEGVKPTYEYINIILLSQLRKQLHIHIFMATRVNISDSMSDLIVWVESVTLRNSIRELSVSIVKAHCDRRASHTTLHIITLHFTNSNHKAHVKGNSLA